MTIARKRSTFPAFAWDDKTRETLDNILMPIGALIALLAVWQILTMIVPTDLPGPIKVVQDTWILILYPFYDRGATDKGLFWQVLASLQRVAIGYALAAIVGISLGILVGLNKRLSKGLDPIFNILRTVPPLAWVPLALAALKQN